MFAKCANVSCHMPSSLPLQKDLNVVVLYTIIGFEEHLLGQILFRVYRKKCFLASHMLTFYV